MDKAIIIAELAKNHNGDIEKALRLSDLAIQNGADIIKLQYYDLSLMPKEHRNYDRYKKSFLSLQELGRIKDYVESRDKKFLLSCFSEKLLVKIKSTLNLDSIKIPSTFASNQNFIAEARKLFKTVFMSHGFDVADLYSIRQLDFITMYSVSLYPTPLKYINFRDFNYRGGLFDQGFSDHTIGLTACLMAYTKNAQYIEKHFNFAGSQKSWEMTPKELLDLRTKIDEISEIRADCDDNKKKQALVKNLSFFRSEYPVEFLNDAS